MRASAREKPILDGDPYVEGGTMVRACSRKVARKAVALATRATLVIGAVSLAYPAPAVWSADREVVVRATALEPHVLRAVAGQSVSFVKRVDRAWS
jgi:hypothetical protein